MEERVMQVKTLKQAKIASERTSINLSLILQAFNLISIDIKTECRKKLQNAITNEERWEVYNEAPSCSEVEKQALLDILQNATNDERWEVYNEAPPCSEVEKQAIREYILNFKDD